MIELVFDSILPGIGHALGFYIGMRVAVTTAFHLLEEMMRREEARR